jgi:hypothetical protein
VFLSHTAELREFPRDRSFVAAEAAVREAGDAITDMAYFPARGSQADKYSRTRVRGCDVYVGPIGLCYGTPVRDEPEVSYSRAPPVRSCRREHVAEAHAYAMNGVLTRDIESHHRGLRHQDASADREGHQAPGTPPNESAAWKSIGDLGLALTADRKLADYVAPATINLEDAQRVIITAYQIVRKLHGLRR